MPEPVKKGRGADKVGAKAKADVPEVADGVPVSTGELAPEVLQMALGCFDRADQATVRGNFDYAIHLYMEGLRYNPRDIERGYKGVRNCALKKGKGGGLGAIISQARGAFTQMLGRHKDTLLSHVAALANDPQNVMLLMQCMQTARRMELPEVAMWFGEVASEETMRTKKPQKQIFTTLADLYEEAERYQEAVSALNQAVKIDPSDRTIDKKARDLAARASIQDGKLENVSDFRDMIRDKRTASSSATQQVVRTQEQLENQYQELKERVEADPKNPVKIQDLADCAARMGNMDEAMTLLNQALDLSKEYRYKARMDDIRMGEIRRVLREIDEQLTADPSRADLKAKRAPIVAQRDAFELEVFTERQKQYPTDMAVRYELGLRQLRAGKHDDAIVSFQTATRDPKRRISALNMLGKCFFAKKLYAEAQSQFETAIGQYEMASDPLGKELRYNLAKTFEAQGKVPEAIQWFSDIVQQDYQYRDAAKRLEGLRKSGQVSGQPGNE